MLRKGAKFQSVAPRPANDGRAVSQRGGPLGVGSALTNWLRQLSSAAGPYDDGRRDPRRWRRYSFVILVTTALAAATLPTFAFVEATGTIAHWGASAEQCSSLSDEDG